MGQLQPALEKLDGSIIGTNVPDTDKSLQRKIGFAGYLDGDLDGESIHITAEARVKGDVSAKDLLVDGRIEGNVTAVKVRLTPVRLLGVKW